MSAKKFPNVNYEVCVACSVCVYDCPFDSLALKTNVYGKDKVNKLTAYPVLANKGKCTSCGICSKACPVTAITMII